ncbi:unnamed protein product [Cladocopium goreaui]|uniref:Uncharacterized protein n=1 Tax=Cladocopium goreaui TaxID=2562237 RepID=A0A9P1GCL2_9DINO|nr:unnamed protein product [Cladocopium goreaui]
MQLSSVCCRSLNEVKKLVSKFCCNACASACKICAGWDRAEFEWCCQNMPREGCEEERHFRLQAQKKVGQDDSVQAQKRLDSLVARSQSLESQRLFQILGAWAAGSLTFFALHRVLPVPLSHILHAQIPTIKAQSAEDRSKSTLCEVRNEKTCVVLNCVVLRELYREAGQCMSEVFSEESQRSLRRKKTQQLHRCELVMEGGKVSTYH